MSLNLRANGRVRLRRACLMVAAFALAAIAAGLRSHTALAQPARAAADTGGGTWSNPTADNKPMARSWWPDASSGETQAGLNLISSHINSLAQGGLGGMEIAFLADRLTGIPASSTLPPSQQLGQPGVDQSTVQTSAGQCCVAYTNAQAKTLGFGSENWQKVLTQIFKTTNADRMHVDLTLTQHWPLATDNIDPNDVGQQQQAATAYSPITSADVAAGTKDVPLPKLRLQDQDNVPFIFVDHYAAASIAKVASVSSSGTPTFSYASLTDASAATSEKKTASGSRAGYPAGIMDANWIQNNPNTFTGTLTSGSTTISNVSSTTGAIGQAGSVLSGPGIPNGDYIVSVGSNSLTISQPARASGSESIDARWNINTVNADWGPDPSTDPDGKTFTGKIDAEGDRRRMADWQYEYQTKLDSGTLKNLGCTVPAPGAALAAGDCVLVGTYYQGTGQTRSGGVNEMQYNREYVNNIYDSQGTQAVIDFWNNRILGSWNNGVVTQPLGDTQLINLIRQNARANPEDAVFEDSFELSKAGQVRGVSSTGPQPNFWAADLLGEMTSRFGYDAAQYAPLLAGSLTFDSSAASGELPATRVQEDMVKTLGHDFTQHHVVALQKWAKRTLDYNFKVQAEGGAPGITGVEPLAGIQEGDNGATDDSWRNLQGAANLNGTNIVSDEALTFGTDYTTGWTADVEALNLDWAGGANRVNMHGTPFNTTFDGLPLEYPASNPTTQWPGWEFQHGSATGYGVFDARQPWWQDMNELTGYIAHTQAVLQGGVAKPDIAVLEGTNDAYSLPHSNSLQSLLDAGWSYNIIDGRMLRLPNATVSRDRSGNAVLDAHGPTNGLHDGPGYRAIVVSGVTELTPATVRKLIGYAKQGLPIIFYNSTITRVYGTNQPGGSSTSLAGDNDTALAATMRQLMATKNVYTVSPGTQTALIGQLNAVGITPAASYAAPGLETLHRQIGGGQYYYLYSGGISLTAAAPAGATGLRLSSTNGLSAGEKLVLDSGSNAETVTIASIPSPAPAAPSPNVLLTAPLVKSHNGTVTSGMFGGSTTTYPSVSPVSDLPVTLRGDGQPYRLDPWTGAVTPIAQYTEHNGSVTVPLTLQAEESALIEVGPRRFGADHATGTSGGEVLTAPRGRGLSLRADKAGTYQVTFAHGRTRSVDVRSVPSAPDLSGGWSLKLDSFGPDPAADATNPEISAITTVQFPSNALGTWSNLPATSAQLSALGVSSMSQVSGRGYYTNTFSLPSSWNRNDGAELSFAHGSDMITAVTVNGHTISQVNQITDTVDVGRYLRAGSNTVVVKLDSLFGNRVGRATQSYGLTGVTFTPYVDVPLSEGQH